MDLKNELNNLKYKIIRSEEVSLNCKKEIEKDIDAIIKQLPLTSVGVATAGQLLDFRRWQEKNWKDVYLYSEEFMVRTYLESN